MAHNYNETVYLENAVGMPLVKAITEVCEKRPSDPIEYIGHFLYKYKEQVQTDSFKLCDTTDYSLGNNCHVTTHSLVAYHPVTKSNWTASCKEYNNTNQLGDVGLYDCAGSNSQPEHMMSQSHEYIALTTVTMVHEHLLCNIDDIYDDDDLS